MSNLNYTKKIENGVLKLSQMEVGASIVGVITEATKSGQYNTGLLVLNLPGNKDVRVYTAGNLKKFFDEDLAKGKYEVGKTIVITRKEDRTFEGASGIVRVGQYSAYTPDTRTDAASRTTNPAMAAVPGVSKQQKLQAELNQARTTK